ncbi:XK-related protein 7-like [Centruroides vittatus]|uniref:XK-related protein 7-like n=1 Tax=Centruroides vittatus TaxID=120091 RepID=UPI00350FB81F
MVRCKENLREISNEEQTYLDCVDGKVLRPDDSSERKFYFTTLEVVGIIWSIITFLFDTVMDIVVAYLHYTNGNIKYFILTTIFIIVPALTMTCFSIRWYLQDLRILEEAKIPKPSRLKWFARCVLLAFQLGPVLRYVDSLIYGLKSRKKKDKATEFYYQRMLFEDTDAALLRLFEAFMEAAPQVVLQIYIIVKKTPHDSDETLTVVAQGLSILGSLLSLSWALAYYHRVLRLSLQSKQNISWTGTILQILWHFFIISARVLSLGLLATLSPVILGVACFCHWLIMTSWIISMKTRFCDTKFEEIFYNAVLGVIFIFCYFNPIDSPTRFRYTIYFVVTFVENAIIIAVWYNYVDPLPWFYLLAILIVVLSFIIGTFFMVLYYLIFHPTGEISIWKKTNYILDQNNETVPKKKDVYSNSQI